ncbi:GNAT family N-acetyltransferase [Cellulomonas sp. zg-ZUI22]|uniref:GNAT family N-acetyltransferase n=1 Tax=Cellulomonas sp. zg-ZUI22 TaxID=2816955 RepID=UPI001A93C4F9|nr:GNAT family N-acetyltransferase [Cellulomonas sp. zg-ZUI22]MBO0899488.1 GNAT family N-acetyltransferase [Cellulomonas sp. zg-ZUI22]
MTEPSTPPATVPHVRDARPADVAAICAFGQEHVRAHYAPLIGDEAADAQVRDWWNPSYVAAGVEASCVVVADVGGACVGVGQRGRYGADHVVYKLYVDPAFRGHGLGPRLIDGLVRRLPPEVTDLCVEHVAANARAAAFYEREGFTVERIDPNPSGNRALDVVWRRRRLTADPLR